MHYSIEKKLFFFHIPKTAGTSILTKLIEYCPDSKETRNSIESASYKTFLKNQNNHAIRQLPSHEHVTQSEFKQLMGISMPTYDNSFTEFVVVRNPLDRVLSQYNYEQARAGKWENATECSFEHFLDVYECFLNGEIVDVQTTSITQPIYWYRSQLDWTSNPLTNNLRIFKFEDIHKLWDFLSTDFDIPEPEHLNKLNRGTKYIDKGSLTQHQKNRVYAMFEEEFDILNYPLI